MTQSEVKISLPKNATKEELEVIKEAIRGNSDSKRLESLEERISQAEEKIRAHNKRLDIDWAMLSENPQPSSTSWAHAFLCVGVSFCIMLGVIAAIYIDKVL